MNRLDQLAQPIRRNGEHVRSILERERRERELEMLDETSSLASGSTRRGYAGGRGKRAGGSASANTSGTSTAVGAMSRSMTHLAGGGARGGGGGGGKYSLGGGISSSFRPLGSVGQRDSSKSMTQISYTWSQFGGTPNNNTKSTNNTSYSGYNNNSYNSNNSPHTKQEQRQSNLGLQTSATKKYLLSSSFSASFSTLSANATRRAQQQYATATNPQFYRYLDLDPNSLLLMNSSSLLVNAGVCDNNNTKTTITFNQPHTQTEQANIATQLVQQQQPHTHT